MVPGLDSRFGSTSLFIEGPPALPELLAGPFIRLAHHDHDAVYCAGRVSAAVVQTADWTLESEEEAVPCCRGGRA